MPTAVTPVNVTPGTTSAWTDVSVADYVPEGATGIIVHVVNTDTNERPFGLRKKGSTDNRTGTLYKNGHLWACVGLDANRTFQGYMNNASFVSFSLVGYFGSEAVFFDDAIDISIETTAAFTDTDISSYTDGNPAIAAFVETTRSGSSLGLRKNGSTDNRYATTHPHSFGIVGLDENKIFEQRIGGTTTKLYLNGYLKSGGEFYANGIDRSLGSTGTWTDLAALPEGATFGVYDIVNPGNSAGLRPKGSSEDIVFDTNKHWAVVPCDGSRVVQGNISDTAVDFYEIGYLTAAVIGGGGDPEPGGARDFRIPRGIARGIGRGISMRTFVDFGRLLVPKRPRLILPRRFAPAT